MADGRSGSRGAVPIALGSAGGGTEEGREFFQSRVALFGGWVALISGTFYAAYWFLTLSIAPPVQLPTAPIGDPNLYHLAATLVAGALWVLVRPRVQLVDASARVAGGYRNAAHVRLLRPDGHRVCASARGVGQDPMHGIFAGLSADSYVLLITRRCRAKYARTHACRQRRGDAPDGHCQRLCSYGSPRT